MLGFTHSHTDVAFNVVVDYAGDSAVHLCLQRLVLEGIVAAANERYFTLNVDAGIVDFKSYAGNGDVFERMLRAVGKAPAHVLVQFFIKVVFLCRGGAGFYPEHDFIVVCNEISALNAADGRNGQRRRVGRRRAYGTIVGVSGERGVTLFAALRGAVIVTCRNDKADARSVYLVVYVVNEAAVLFARKSAGRAQRHIDRVHAEQYGVLDRRDYILGFTALGKIGENLHTHELRVYRHADYSLFGLGLIRLGRFAADYAGNVRAVLGIEGEYVVVLIRVVVRVGHLYVDVYVVKLESDGGFSGVACGKYAFNALAGDGISVQARRRHSGKYGVGKIESGVKHGNRRSFTGVLHASGIEYTGVVHVNEVDHARRAAGLDRLRTVVGVADVRSRYSFAFAYLFKVAVGGFDGNRVGERVIAVFYARDQSAFGQLVYKTVLIFGDDCGFSLSFGAGCVLCQRFVAVAFQIRVGKTLTGQLYYCDYRVFVLIAVVLYQILGFNTRSYLLLRELVVGAQDEKLLRFVRFIAQTCRARRHTRKQCRAQ